MSRRKKKKAAGWGEEYVELESETAALLQSIRKGPEKQIKKSTSMKNVKNVENVRSSPLRTGKKKQRVVVAHLKVKGRSSRGSGVVVPAVATEVIHTMTMMKMMVITSRTRWTRTLHRPTLSLV